MPKRQEFKTQKELQEYVEKEYVTAAREVVKKIDAVIADLAKTRSKIPSALDDKYSTAAKAEYLQCRKNSLAEFNNAERYALACKKTVSEILAVMKKAVGA